MYTVSCTGRVGYIAALAMAARARVAMSRKIDMVEGRQETASVFCTFEMQLSSQSNFINTWLGTVTKSGTNGIVYIGNQDPETTDKTSISIYHGTANFNAASEKFSFGPIVIDDWLS